MSMIQFVRNYDDLSTDKGFQFKFHCDKCGNGFISQYETRVLGVASSVLNAAGSLFGWGYSAGHSAYEIQRAIGGREHDGALHRATEQGRQHFHQCTRCGRWVCPEVCWNAQANLCEECAPKYEEELPSAQAQARAQALREQLYTKAQATDYASAVDMRAPAQAAAPSIAGPATPTCRQCAAPVAGSKFCPQCGTPVQTAPSCPKCSAINDPDSRFCGQCGNRLG